MIKELSQRHQVTLLTTHAPSEDPGALQQQLHSCKQVLSLPFELPKQGSARFATALMRSWVSAYPVDLWKCRITPLANEVKRLITAGSIDICIADFLAATPNVRFGDGVPIVLFEHNVEHLIWRRMSSHEPRLWRRVLLEFESLKMRFYEANACRQANLTLTVSETDRSRLQEIAPSANTAAVPTGVDTAYFTPQGEPLNDHSLVFTGSLDWYPNEDAIIYFLDAILPAIRTAVPDITFTIVGRNPKPRLKTAAAESGAHLTGTVDDVRPYVSRAAVFVVPLRIGSGTRLKIFEALAMGKAVVSTTVGAEGLGLTPGIHFLQADTPAEFASAVISLLVDPALRAAIGKAARHFVETHYSWSHVSRHFESYCQQLLQPEHQP